MKILKYIVLTSALIFLTLNVIQSNQEKAILSQSKDEALEAVIYFKAKSIEHTKQSQLQKNLITQKNQQINELKTTTNLLNNKAESLQQKNRALEESYESQALILEQQQNEILILKQELLEYISSP